MLNISGVSAIHSPRAPIRLSSNRVHCNVGRVDDRCVTVRNNLRIFLYDAPERPARLRRPIFFPEPSIESNVLLVRLPKREEKAIIVPPPLQHHVVYVLNKVSHPQVIEARTPVATNPKVYYVNYDEGVDLQTVFSLVLGDDGTVGGSGVTVTHEGMIPSDYLDGKHTVETDDVSNIRDFGKGALFRDNVVPPFHDVESNHFPAHETSTGLGGSGDGYDKVRSGNDFEDSEIKGFGFRHLSESSSLSTEVSSYSSLDSPS